MSKFKIGDRVKAYSPLLSRVGEVVEVTADVITLKCEGSILFYHPKQCRKLKKKTSLKEFWINVYSGETAVVHSNKESALESCGRSAETLHVREVRKKK